jgi:RimJ/RimL family protein N-acetyltransferase
MTTDCRQGRLTFSRYDERFLEKSWQWLHDPEVKRLTMTPDFTRDQQKQWFQGLADKKDYLIWGLLCDDVAIGAMGLKHIVKTQAEYWGYIGERSHWGLGLGREMIQFAFGQARQLGLNALYLNVHRDNPRAIALYTRAGFEVTGDNNGVLRMQTALVHSHER